MKSWASPEWNVWLKIALFIGLVFFIGLTEFSKGYFIKYKCYKSIFFKNLEKELGKIFVHEFTVA